MSDLKLKVCGMRDAENIREVAALNPDFMGFIFYEKSARFVADPDPKIFAEIPAQIMKVGVFVNESKERIIAKMADLHLDYVQLHGDESLEFAQDLKDEGMKVIKVFRVKGDLPAEVEQYEDIADYLLFDTATSGYGGSGKQFDWSMLASYSGRVPVLLSGGLQTGDIDKVKALDIQNLAGIDVNSRFEISPAMKDVRKVEELINTI